ncbi:MAG: hypothetical protein GX267_09930 [Fibrobacter sp.]|jgi:hypothetical protein|nr:hypothetical protein [Fibrobacter sp.]
MKNKACSKEELLISLASKGDAAAFYTLARPYFEIEYLNLRHNGSTHTDAVEKILPDSSALFKKIIGNNPTDLNEWFKNNSEISIPEFGEVAIVNIDKDMAAQQNHFLQEIQLHLLRTASEFNKKRRKKFLEFLRNPRTKMVAGTSAALLLFLILFLLLHLTDSSVHIGFKHAGKEFNFVIGSPSQELAASDSSLTSAVSVPDSSTIDSIAKDTVVSTNVEEKKTEPPPVKKVYRPKVVTAEQPRVSPPPPSQVAPPSVETTPVVEEPASPTATSGSSNYSTTPENPSDY